MTEVTYQPDGTFTKCPLSGKTVEHAKPGGLYTVFVNTPDFGTYALGYPTTITILENNPERKDECIAEIKRQRAAGRKVPLVLLY